MLLFISEGEQELALRLFGPGIWIKSRVVGAGVEICGRLLSNVNGTATARTNGRFVLYLGRKDAGKTSRCLCELSSVSAEFVQTPT